MTWRHTLSHPDGVSSESSFRACQIDYVFRQDSHPPAANLTPWGPQKRPAAFLALATHQLERCGFDFFQFRCQTWLKCAPHNFEAPGPTYERRPAANSVVTIQPDEQRAFPPAFHMLGTGQRYRKNLNGVQVNSRQRTSMTSYRLQQHRITIAQDFDQQVHSN